MIFLFDLKFMYVCINILHIVCAQFLFLSKRSLEFFVLQILFFFTKQINSTVHIQEDPEIQPPGMACPRLNTRVRAILTPH